LTGSSVNELFRGIRGQIGSLVTGLEAADIQTMSLGLSHSLSRYKLKFSPDKVDTMIVQAIALLDALDKELNVFSMRVREWYGWHFPELGKIVNDNLMFCRVVKKMGTRANVLKTDFSEILPAELETEVKEAAQISMGTEISNEDIDNIVDLCNQVIDIHDYRDELFEYLKNRMQAIAPNLTALLGELVGARLIAHSGSLLNLAKHPASTVQILGAEKALFRALKTKHETPKYGLIYHASLIGQTTPKNKGKISRLLAAKAVLSCRVDALAEKDEQILIGDEMREKVLARIKQVDGGSTRQLSKPGKISSQQPKKFDHKRDEQMKTFRSAPTYNATGDTTLSSKQNSELLQAEAVEAVEVPSQTKKEKKQKKEKKTKEKKEKKDKKRKREEQEGGGEKKTKKKKKKSD